MDNYAVYVKNANKSYGAKTVLNDLCMKVPRGCIYGLLGASGCGKTTLLSCIVGRKRLDSGQIFTLGGQPGTEGSGVPGPRVGYMPQDIALVAEFTVRDAVFYFGRILNMKDDLIEERFQKLKKLLDLPPDDRFLKNCSGGQQRRVSFAAAMIHKPELLILDEPTVGLDPVLRDSIWNYLVEITEKEKIAVIITTHYIEETKQAHRIGLMREGRLLAEESPAKLLALFGTETLEEVFLILSKRQEEGRLVDIEQALSDDNRNESISIQNSTLSVVDTYTSRDDLVKNTKTYKTGAFSINKNRMKSLLAKNAKQFYRNTGGVSFTIIFPILEMLAFFFAVGGDIRGINLGVVNDESMITHCSNYSKNGTAIPYSFTNCEFHDLGCRFLDEIKDPMFNLIYYDELEPALEDITHGEIVGVMYMASNFSESFAVRLNDPRDISNMTLENSEIQVWMDMSNRQIGSSIKYKLLEKYVDYQVDAMKDCNLYEKLGEFPMRFKYEYGDENDSYTVFMAPGVLLTVMYFLGTTLTSTIIITDRLEGVWDRSIVAGVSSVEIVLTHFMTQFVLVTIQAIEVLLCFVLFKMEYVGSLWLIFVFILLQGLTGMVFGFWVSIISDSHSAANIYTTGLFYPMIILCGMMWPLEGQPAVLRFISNLLPFTQPIVSLRDVIKKGHSLKDLETVQGIGITLLWILIFSIISVFAIKAKR